MLVKELITEVPEFERVINEEFDSMTEARFDAVMKLINHDMDESEVYGTIIWEDEEIALMGQDKHGGQDEFLVDFHRMVIEESDRIPSSSLDYSEYVYTVATKDFLTENNLSGKNPF